MSSTRDVIVTGSKLVFVTVTVKRKMPPGAGRLIGSGDLVIVIVGGTAVIRTVAVATEVTVWLWLSTPVVVMVSVWVAPAFPKKLPENMQVYVPPLAARTAPTAH